MTSGTQQLAGCNATEMDCRSAMSDIEIIGRNVVQKLTSLQYSINPCDLTGFTNLQELHMIIFMKIRSQAHADLSVCSMLHKVCLSQSTGILSRLASINLLRCSFL